ncbi:unnamed protein product [Litomosoides sigmodontis]|uniref:EF-hand domain-containing protein n=1 Tax=Litomosoides sigmodontis TaxID=42156 RepID=A0A3P6TF94_LITSI|nr:unnamed protein product [Litomosoides sigmodontis]
MQTAFEAITMADGTLAISSNEKSPSDASTSELDKSVAEVMIDDGNNNDSLELKMTNLSGSSEQTDDKCINGVAATEENNSAALLPPLLPMSTSRQDHANMVSAVSSPRLLSFPGVRIHRRSSYSESTYFDEPKMDNVNDETEVKNAEHLNTSPSTTLGSLKNPEKDAMCEVWSNQYKLVVNDIPNFSGSVAHSDVLNDKSEFLCISPLRQNHDVFKKFREAPRKFKRFENFEQNQENAWNCSRQVLNTSYPNYDMNSYVASSDENKRNEALVEKETNALELEMPQVFDSDILDDNQHLMNAASQTSSNSIILDDLNDASFTSSFLSRNSDTLTPEKIEEKRNETSFEAILSDDLSSSNLHDGDILEEADQTSPFRIPRFHYPYGIPFSGKKSSNNLSVVKGLFRKYNDQVDLSHMKEICLASGLCPLWKQPLYNCISTSTSNFINFHEFTSWWKKFEENAHDEASRFVYILTNGSRNFLTADDFNAFIQDLIDTLPSLSCLKEAVAFHQAYIKTVMKKFFVYKAITILERAEVNEEREFFSYKHFYVIYCNFYLLDKALTNLAVQRIFSGAVSLNSSINQTIDYIAFVNFLLAEVDKCHPKSIEYWFRIMDLNGDGRISFDEMEQFYNEVVANVVRINMDVLVFNNLVNMLKDMISPHSSTYFTLSDLKRYPPLARYFFNTFINWIKHIAQESCMSIKKNDVDSHSLFNDWNQFCKSEYEILVADLLDSEEQTLFQFTSVNFFENPNLKSKMQAENTLVIIKAKVHSKRYTFRRTVRMTAPEASASADNENLQADMETTFEKLTIADGVLAIKSVVSESSVRSLATALQSPDRGRPRGSVSSTSFKSDEDLNDFILEENYLEDSWGTHSSMITTNTLVYPERSESSTSHLAETTSDQLTHMNSSKSLPRYIRGYGLCWASDSDMETSFDDEDFSLESFNTDTIFKQLRSHACCDKDCDTPSCPELGERRDLDQTDPPTDEINFPKNGSDKP